AFQLTITGYSNVKQSMPILVTQTFDDIGQKIDESIRFGNLSIATLNTAKTHPFFTTFIDWSYFAFFVYIIFVLVILIMEFPPNNVRIQCFLGGLMILWGIGVYTYYLFPMIGPVYHVPEHYLTISNIPQHASNLQQKLLLFHTTLLNNPVSYLPVPFMGIAAMPSFHVAETFYFALALIWIKSWFVRLFGVLMFLITFFGSCYTGWHYFIDGIAGIIWATIVYIFTALCIKYKFSCSTKSPVIQLHLRTDQL
ncbi:MAG: phosphatase PAP2 family protein, partial [Chitinispirillaceae bacterium]|nr:phosphatase PAP2 family protein [Chitinispirillaceae bacterium]